MKPYLNAVKLASLLAECNFSLQLMLQVKFTFVD